MRRNPLFLIPITFLLVVFSITFLHSEDVVEKPHLSVIYASEDYSVTLDGAPVALPSPLPVNAILETGEYAPTDICSTDGSLLILGANTKLKILSARKEQFNNSLKIRVVLVSGRLTFLPSPFGSSIVVDCGNFSASSENQIQVFRNEHCEVFTPDGECLCTIREAKVTLKAGQGLIALKGGEPQLLTETPPSLCTPLHPWDPATHTGSRNSAPLPKARITYKNGTYILDASASTDPDGDNILRCWWTPSSDNIPPLRNPFQKQLFLSPQAGRTILMLFVNDGEKTSSARIEFTARDGNENTPPICSIEGSGVVTPGKEYSYVPSHPVDAEGDPISFSWSVKPQEDVSVFRKGSSIVCKFDHAGEYSLWLHVSDVFGLGSTINRTIKVVDVNLPPVSEGKVAPQVEVNQLVTLDPSSSSDPEGEPLTHKWILESYPPGADVHDFPATGKARVRFTHPGSYTLALYSFDGDVYSTPSHRTIEVKEFEGSPRILFPSIVKSVTGKEITLDASDSYCQDMSRLEVDWKYVSGPPCRLNYRTNAIISLAPFVPGTYHLRITATCDKKIATKDVKLTVHPANTPPKVAFIGPVRGNANEPLEYKVTKSSDAEGDPLDFTWTVRDDDGDVAFKWVGKSLSFTPEKTGTYTVSLVASDGIDDSEEIRVRVSVEKALKRPNPKVKVSPKKPETGEKITLNASSSKPGENGLLSFSWKQLTGASVDLSSPTGVITSFVAKYSGRYSFLLTLSEENGLSKTRKIEVNVSPGNTPPLAVSQTKIFVKRGDKLILDGSASFDPDGENLSAYWTLIEGEDLWGKKKRKGLTVDFEVAEEGIYKFQLTVSDDKLEATSITEVVCGDSPLQSIEISPQVQAVRADSIAKFTVREAEKNASYRWFQYSGLPTNITTYDNTLEAKLLFPGMYEFAVVKTVEDKVSQAQYCLVYAVPAPDGPEIEVFYPKTALVKEPLVLTAASFGKNARDAVFEWVQTGGPMVDLIPENINYSEVSFIPPKSGIYDFSVSALFEKVSSAKKHIRIEIASPVPSPVADAGSDIIATTGETVILDGSLSRQPGGAAVEFKWRQLGGPKQLFSEEQLGRKLEFKVPLSGIYSFELFVDNGYGSSSDEVIIRSNPENSKPTADISYSPVLYEGELLILDGSNSQDPDNDRITYQFTQLSGPELGLSNIPRSLPFIVIENIPLGKYTFELRVSDGLSGISLDSTTIEIGRRPRKLLFEPNVIFSPKTVDLFSYLAYASKECDCEFLASSDVIRSFDNKRIEPFNWITPLNRTLDNFALHINTVYRDLKKHPAEKDLASETQRYLLTRTYNFLQEEERAIRSYTFEGISNEKRTTAMVQFSTQLLAQCMSGDSKEFSQSDVRIIANLPLSGHEIFSSYVNACSYPHLSIPFPGRKSIIRPLLSNSPIYVSGECLSLFEAVNALAANTELPELMIDPSIKKVLENTPLSDQFRAEYTSGWLTTTRFLLGLAKFYPWLVWKTDASGYLTFCALDRRAIVGSCENVWDSGELMAIQLPIFRKLKDPSLLIHRIKEGDDILEALWKSSDTATFCGVDPLNRLILFNSPEALDYTGRFLWKMLEDEFK